MKALRTRSDSLTIRHASLVKGELRIAQKRPGCAEQAQQQIYSWVREGVEQGESDARAGKRSPLFESGQS